MNWYNNRYYSDNYWGKGYGGNYRSTNVGFKTETLKKDYFSIIKNIVCPPPPRVLERRFPESLTFSDLAWVKINCYTHLADTYEITGYGKVEDGIITDIKIMKQSVQAAHASATEDATLEMMNSIPMDEMHMWSLDWHSHVDMSTFMSKTDTDNYNKRYNEMSQYSFPTLVFNKKQSIKCEEWFGSDDSLSIEVYYPDTVSYTDDELKEIFTECENEVLRLVTKTTYTYKPKTTSYTTSSNVTATTSYASIEDKYKGWTAEDFANCKWDYDKKCFIKSDGKIPRSKKAEKRLRKIRNKLEQIATKKQATMFKKFVTCCNCDNYLEHEVEKDVGYCKACIEVIYQLTPEEVEDMFLWSGNSDTSIDDDDEVLEICELCKTNYLLEDEEKESGLCMTCIEQHTHLC